MNKWLVGCRTDASGKCVGLLMLDYNAHLFSHIYILNSMFWVPLKCTPTLTLIMAYRQASQDSVDFFPRQFLGWLLCMYACMCDLMSLGHGCSHPVCQSCSGLFKGANVSRHRHLGSTHSNSSPRTSKKSSRGIPYCHEGTLPCVAVQKHHSPWCEESVFSGLSVCPCCFFGSTITSCDSNFQEKKDPEGVDECLAHYSKKALESHTRS